MKSDFFQKLRRITLAVSMAAAPIMGQAGPEHGISMYGAPALPPDFVSLPYANPDAPKGGKIVFGEVGSFDSLNPHIQKGSAPYLVRAHVFESLLGRNWDEPFALYGLVAESIEVPEDRSWVEFTLRETARFSDGSPVTVDDVIWSIDTLGTQGHARYANSYKKIAAMAQTGPRSLRVTFNTPDREMPLILGLRPILKKAQYDGVDFADSGNIPPIGTGAYVIGEYDYGRVISLRRNPDYWGADLGFNRGRHNLDELRAEYFLDGTAAFEAFKAGIVTTNREGNALKWQTQYDFPAVTRGDMVKSIIPHQRPSGIRGLVMNTRREVFADWRVRQAMTLAFNFTFVNNALNGGTEPRITSYFSNSILSMQPGPAKGRVAELLAPFADSLPPGALEGYRLPMGSDRAANRRDLRTASALLAEAGYTLSDGQLMTPAGQPARFDILVQQGAGEYQTIVDIYVEALKRLGITPSVTIVDAAQYRERTNTYDFDMTHYIRALSLSPGNEQRLYWGADGVTIPGSRNWMGVDSPAADAMIDVMLNAASQDEYVAAVQALDRVLTAGRYVIPIWFSPYSRIAHDARLKFPADRLAIYGDWIGFQPDVWWYEN